MKNTRTCFIFILLFAASELTGWISAQPGYDRMAFDTLFEQKLAGRKVGLYPGHTIGSSYFNDEWCRGDILLVTGNLVKNKQLKYNSLTDELLWLRPLDYSMILLEKEQILGFSINLPGLKTLQFKKMLLDKTDSEGKFCQVLYEGTYGLYCQRRVVRKEDAVRKGDYSTYLIPVLKKVPLYIILTGTGKTMTLDKISNKTLIINYPYDKKVLKKMLSDMNLRLETETDLISLVKYMEHNQHFF
jgi:hypothetical protein